MISTFRQARFPGAYLPWRDVLHDGPVPQTPGLSELSDVRARSIAGFSGAESHEKIRAEFLARDQALKDFRRHEEVVLWFEHDLYDQLQLIQVLDWFAQEELGKVKLSLIQIGSYPGVKPFYGLGQLSGPQLARLFPTRIPVSATHLREASAAWEAFRAENPAALLQLTQQQSSSLPFLAAALLRFLEEYPWVNDGLSRLERQALRAVAAGHRNKRLIYSEVSRQEDAPWGDASVYLRISGLASGKNPALVEIEKDHYSMTDAGRQLLESKADWIELCGGIDRWLGGVHLKGAQPKWRWDESKKTLVER